jgi:hypothetical protein
MANLGNADTIRLEKSIVIDSKTAKAMEARGEILPSDGYVDRDRGEVLAPALIAQQEVVDATTAMRLAAQRGINLAPSVDVAANVHMSSGNPVLNQGGGIPSRSKMPTAILESFRKQPALIPDMTPPALNPDFVAEVQEANRRLNKVSPDPRIPRTASQNINEQRIPTPATNIYAQMETGNYSQPTVPVMHNIPATSASIDYSVISAIIKEAVREVMKDINIKEVVKEVLAEERTKMTKQTINENIQIKIGDTVFSGKMLSVQAPKKK